MALRDTVEATADRTVRDDEATVTVFLKNGKTLSKYVSHALGSLERPMSDKDLEAKFSGLCEGILTPAQTATAIQSYWDAPSIQDAKQLIKVAVKT